MANTYQSLKSSNIVRIDTGKAFHLYAARNNLGESLMCPASAQKLQNDVYGRPATQNTLTVNLDASCAQGTPYDATRHIQIENMNRPYLPICTAGLRGAGDFMGVGRDLLSQDLYGTGHRGDMVRIYNTRNNAPWEWETPVALEPQNRNYYWRVEQQWNGSHDASISTFAGN